MARNCRKTNLKLLELKTRLKNFIDTVEPGSKDYKLQLDMLRLEYTGPSGSISNKQFKEALQEVQIDTSFTESNTSVSVPQLQNKSLAFKNMSTLYRNATSALGYMKHDFNIRMFKAIFIDNTNYGQKLDKSGKYLLNDIIKRVPVTTIEINGNIAKLKNDLIDIICSEFGIDNSNPVFMYAGNNSVIDQDKYVQIMSDPRVTSWIARANSNLHVADQHTLQVHSALFILNNFDDLVSEYLPKIVSIAPQNKGLLTNVKYVKETEGNAPSIWSVDDLITYGSDLYASNLGKFILSTINKVDADLKPIEGAYMTSQDSFVIASLLKEAEYEYHILKKDSQDYNPNLSFRTNLTEAVKVLMKMGLNDELDSLKKFKKEIFPVYNWLYNSDENTIGVQKIYTDLFKSGQVKNITQILNLENVLAGEIIKNVAPVYIESTTFDSPTYTSSPVRTINVSHTFRGTSYITQNLKAQIFDELRIDAKDQNEVLNMKLSKQKIDSKTVDELLNDGTKESEEFKKAFELLFGIPLSREFLQGMKLGKIENAKSYISDVIYKISELFIGAASQDEDKRESYFNDEFSKIFLVKNSDFRNKYTNITQTVADRKVDIPLTIIKSFEGKSIPIYRLGSTIFEDVYLINKLKQGQVNRGCKNFLIDNLHVLSNINNPKSEQIIRNEAYQGATGLRLETISEIGSNPANNSSGKEAYINSFFGDFLGLGLDEKGHSISVQLMTLSDKASIFTKIINLDAVIDGYGLGKNRVTLNKSLDNMSNEELQNLYYYFRKNQVVDEIYHIIDTWNKVLNLNLQIPDINLELANSGEMLPQTSEFIKISWERIKKAFEETGIKDKGPKGIEKLLRSYKEKNPNSDINLVKDLHYSFYKGVTTLNKNIYFHYKQVRSKQNFEDQINKYTSKNIAHPWFNGLDNLAKKSQGKDILNKYCSNHGLQMSIDGSIPYDVIKRKIILDAFLRSQLLDLHFKGPQLDAIKNMSDYDEESDVRNNIIEADSKYKAAGKRPVDLPGTKQNFAQGLIDGVSEIVNVAHIEEPKEEVWSPSGVVENGLEVLNGSGRISYIYAMMESASMTGNPFKGINRKTLGEHVDDYYSTLYKWAEYLINNWHMRNSSRSKYKLEELFEKMHNFSFDEDINLTESFLRPGKKFTPEMANGDNPVFFSTGLHYYQLKNLVYKGNNTYDITLKEVNNYGEEMLDPVYPPNLVQTQNVQINNLYDLYKVLGGTESMAKQEDGQLGYSDNSLKMLYNYVINIGTVLDENYDKLDQSTVRQPLRDKFIAIAASDSGIKRGATNVNGKEVYTNKELQLLISKIRTALFGAQMDVYHHIDNESEATEPTQTLAALATNGNTREEANKVYNAISSIISANMKAITTANMTEYNEETAETIIKDLTKDIMNIINESGSDLQQAIVDVCDTYLGKLIPVSDQMFYNAFHSYNIQQLNKLALRRKYSGLGGVLNPSSNSYQLFTIGKRDLEYDDLVKRARQNFALYEDVLSDLTTKDLANLYLFSETDTAKQQIVNQDGIQVKYITNLLDQILANPVANHEMLEFLKQNIKIIEDNLKLKDGELTEQEFKSSIQAVGRKISRTQADPLDTVFYKKGEKYYKLTLDSAKNYFDLVNDPEIQDVWMDITTPHDLKPQIVKYTYNNETHSLYESDAGEMSYLLNTLDLSEIDEIVADNAEEGRQNEEQCKQALI